MPDTLPSLLAELDAALEDANEYLARIHEAELKMVILRDRLDAANRRAAAIRIQLDKLAKEMAGVVAAMSKDLKS